jgi:hypothetical protein
MKVNVRRSSPTMCVALICVALLTGCQKEAASPELQKSEVRAEAAVDKSVGRDELVSTLASKDFDRTISLMNRIKRMRYQGDVLPLLSEVWQLNLAAMPDVDKGFVTHPRIRLEVADVLMQASRNGAPNLEPAAYVDYARQHARSKDPDVARQAVLVLGVANDPVDIGLLAEILSVESEATFRAAAIALVRNCAVDEARVSRIADSLRSRELQADLRKSWTDAQGLRRHVCR